MTSTSFESDSAFNGVICASGTSNVVAKKSDTIRFLIIILFTPQYVFTYFLVYVIAYKKYI